MTERIKEKIQCQKCDEKMVEVGIGEEDNLLVYCPNCKMLIKEFIRIR